MQSIMFTWTIENLHSHLHIPSQIYFKYVKPEVHKATLKMDKRTHTNTQQQQQKQN